MPIGSARLRLSAKFYLVAMLFVIFDVEALFLFAWSVSVRESGWAGFIEATVFISHSVGRSCLPLAHRRARLGPEASSASGKRS